jgi:hypothetical protein
MIQMIELRQLMDRSELIPQAILSFPVENFARQYGEFIHDHDALDYFEGAAFKAGNVQFALIHHRGDRPNTTTIYLPLTTDDVAEITKTINYIVGELKLPPETISWQRADELNIFRAVSD